MRTAMAWAAFGCMLGAASAGEPAAPLDVKYLRREPAQAPFPPRVHLKLTFANASPEARWIVSPLSRTTRLPENGQFSADPEDGFPFVALSAGADKAKAVVVGFLGEPRVFLVRVPARAKVTLDDFEIPTAESLAEFDWAEAKSASVVVDGQAKPLETWLGPAAASSADAVVPAGATWTDLFAEVQPKGKVTRVTLDVVRRGRLAVAGFETPARFYVATDPTPSAIAGPWKLEVEFRAVRPLKVEQLDFAPDGKQLVVSLQTGKVVALDLVAKREHLFRQSESARARFFAFAPNGSVLMRQAGEAEVTVRDWTRDVEWASLFGAGLADLGAVDRAASPDGRRVAHPQKTTVRIVDLEKADSFALALPDDVRELAYRSGAFSADGKRFVAGYEHALGAGKAVVWNLPASPPKEPIPSLATFENRQTGLHYVSLSADGKRLAIGGKQASNVWVWNVETKEEQRSVGVAGFRTFHAVTLSPDGATVAEASLLVRGAGESGLSLRSAGRDPLRLPGLEPPIHALRFASDGRRLAAGDHLGTIRLWRRD